MTAFGLVGMGIPLPVGVPQNFRLLQAAQHEFCGAKRATWRMKPSDSNILSQKEARNSVMGGEKQYRELFLDMRADTNTWLQFFDEVDNSVFAERSTGILGTYATILRQRGELIKCEETLDMAREVLTRYQRASVGAPPNQQFCCDVLTFKHNVIRYNLKVQQGKYEECIPIFRELATFELKHDKDFEDQMYLFMIPGILSKPPSSLDTLRDAEILKMVMAPLQDGLKQVLGSVEESQAVQLHRCSYPGCSKQEEGLGDLSFKKCRGCGMARYCSKECQKKDWKAHKRVCNNAKKQ